MKPIEPIIRLCKYQLEEVLPPRIELEMPAQSADVTILYAPPPAQIKNAFRALEQQTFPALTIMQGETTVVDAESLMDDPGGDCATWRHGFAVQIALTCPDDAESVENLTYIISRYAMLVIEVVTQFEQSALSAAYTASHISTDLNPVSIVAEAVFYDEPNDKTRMLRTAHIEFAAYV